MCKMQLTYLRERETVWLLLQLLAERFCLDDGLAELQPGSDFHGTETVREIPFELPVVQPCDTFQPTLTMSCRHVLCREPVWADDAVEYLTWLTMPPPSAFSKQVAKVPLTRQPANISHTHIQGKA
jgi:hypothetical protein